MKFQLTLVTLLLLIAGCGNGEQGEENGESGTESQRAATPVSVTELQPVNFRHYVTVQGDVESEKTIMISPQSTARVQEIAVRAGDEVSQGDLLARLDGEVTRSQIREVESQLELAETLLERQKNLREQDIGSEVEFLQAQNRVESLQNQLATLREQFENYIIRAPINGTVNQVDLKIGETVGPAAPVFQLSNMDALKVTAEVSEAYITRIDLSDSVEILFPSLEETISAKLDVVSKVINPSNRTFRVEIYISGLEGLVRPNMVAKVRINDLTLRDRIVVPLNAIQMADEITFAFVAEETEGGFVARQRELVTGQSYENELVVEEGLRSGDLLISAGNSDLTDGQAISLQEH